MKSSSCIIYTSIFFDDFRQMRLEFERNLKNYSNHYEIRFDLFKNRSLEELEKILEYLNSINIDYIFTFRSKEKNEIEKVYTRAMQYNPPILDIDMDSFIFKNQTFKKSKLMISYHGENDDDIQIKLKNMWELEPYIYKIALIYTNYDKFISDLQYVRLFKKEQKIKIAYIPMGTFNSFLRVISAYFVSDYSYASYTKTTAPGQISLEQFNTIFNMFTEKYE
ncbi:type I 3-dehydroquinate dehydratase [Ferroplasma sp.]|uniref:type I 3-dehydroquinate dehydratase n=1 Tax=Ferroplasma sp. TaxID=2591003 RepID=UPI00307E3441